MVQSLNAEFERVQGSPQREPQYSLVLWSDDDELTITSHTITGITSPEVLQGRITNISGWTQGIDADAFFTTVGQIQVRLRDADGSLASAIATRRAAGLGLRSQRAVVLRGDSDLDYDDFVPAVTYRVEDYRSNDGEVTLILADIQRGLDDTIMVPHTARLRKSITENQSHVPVFMADPTGQFPLVRRGPNYRYQLGVNDWGIINVDGEWMIHQGTITHPTDGLSFDILLRGAFYSTNVAHEVDTTRPSDEWPEITEVFYLEAPAVQMLYALLTGELYGQTATLPPHWHLNLPSTWVRLADFVNIGTDIWDPVTNTGRMAVLNGESELNAKQFIDEQLNPIINGLMTVYNSGDLGLRRRRTPTAGASADVTLTVHEIISADEIHYAQQNILNHYRIPWDYDPVNERYRQTTEVTDASAAIDGKTALRTIPLRTVQNTKTGTTEVLEYTDELRDRTANPPLLWRVQVSPRLDNLEVGDTARIVYPFNTDPTTGEPINRSFEILQIENDWQEGTVFLNLYGATGRSNPIARTLATELLDDAFYSEGTNLASVLTINGSGDITADGSLAGATTLTAGVYYYDGDLTLPAGRTLTISRNVWLRIKGFFDLQGTIDGTGNAEITSGTAGVFGSSASGKNLTSLGLAGITFTAIDGNSVKGAFDVVPRVALTNNNGALELPFNDLRGTPGAPSDPLLDPLNSSTTLVPSRLGGAAGAGLAITCRGMQAQGGEINLSGEDGLAGEVEFYSTLGPNLSSIQRYLYGASSGGGCPGACVVAIDGFNAMPTLDDVIVSRYGISPRTPDRPTAGTAQSPSTAIWVKSWGTMLPAQDGTAPLGGQASYLRAYVPNLPTVKPYDPIIDTPQPTSITLQPLVNTPPTPAKDRVTIEVDIDLGSDPAIASVDLFVRKNTGPWEFLQRAITSAIFERKATADTYWVQARTVDTQGRVAKDGPVDSVTLTAVADATDGDLVPAPSLSVSVQSSGIVVTQSLGPEYEVELREGATWGSSTRLITGRWSIHEVGRRAPGSYTLLAKGINAAGTYSTATASISVTVNQLGLPTIGVRPGIGSVAITLQNTDDLVRGHKVWLSTNNGFNPNALTPDYEGPDTAITLPDLDMPVTYYLRVRPYSEFGDSSNTSTQFTFDTLAPAVSLDGAVLSSGEILTVEGIIQATDPVTSYEANWGLHSLAGTAYLMTFRDDLGNVITSVDSEGELTSSAFTFGDVSANEYLRYDAAGLVLQGAKFETSSGGARVVIDPSDEHIQIYSDSGLSATFGHVADTDDWSIIYINNEAAVNAGDYAVAPSVVTQYVFSYAPNDVPHTGLRVSARGGQSQTALMGYAYGEGPADNITGVHGIASPDNTFAGDHTRGVWGDSDNPRTSTSASQSYGGYFTARGGYAAAGVYSVAYGDAVGAGGAAAIWGVGSAGALAGLFQGSVTVTGNLSVSGNITGSLPNHSASLLTSGTLASARLPADVSEQYRGSSSSQLSFPIGHIVFVMTSTSYFRNESTSIYVSGNTSYADTPGGSSLSGTWRSRGQSSLSNGELTMFQRTA